MSFNINNLLICQAQIFLPDGSLLKGDVRINEGKIAQISPKIASSKRDKIIDATILTLLPE